MADTAYQVVYRDEWTKAFERDVASLRRTVATEAIISGRQAVFLVAASNREAVGRGANGLIPSASDDLTQPTATLTEAHDKPRKTRYNVFAGQSDQRAIMQNTSRGVINRKIDQTIIDILTTATVEANTTTSVMTKALVNKALTRLFNSDVQNDGMIYGAVTPAAWAHLSDIDEFASQDYVNDKPLVDGMPTGVMMKRWNGVTWCSHTLLPAAGLSTAECFIYHRNAIGHAYDRADVQVYSGYDEEDDYYWARHSIYQGAVLLQNSGIVKINHDDSQLSA